MTLRVLLVDDHAIVREGYRALLEKQDDICVVGEAGDGEAAYRFCLEAPTDVVVMDLTMPGPSGIDSIARLRQRHPALRILVLTMHQDAAFATQALRAGADGYVTKSSPPARLVQAVRDVHRGLRPLSPDVAHAMAVGTFERDGLTGLSPREFVVLRARVAGRSIAEVAEQLHLSPKTVANLHYGIKRKLGVASDIELVRLAMRRGWADDAAGRESREDRACDGWPSAGWTRRPTEA